MLNTKSKPVRYILQAFNYAVFMALVWYFSTSPSFRQIEEDQAVITVAFSHAGETREPCRTLSQEELQALPPNMRKPTDCPRERSPIIFEIHLDDEVVYSKTAEAPGLFKDGGVNIFHSVKVPAGDHRLLVKMDDSVQKEGFDYTFEQDVFLRPAQILLVAFPTKQGFVLK